MSSKPLVSIIIPTYNYQQYIVEAVESVLNQTYDQELIEIIIVDDGSTDDTENVIKPLIGTRLHYYKQKNNGKAAATAFAIAKAAGKYIFNLDADDYFYPNKIQVFVDIFESDESLSHVANAADFIATGKVTGRENFPDFISDKTNPGLAILDFFYTNGILFGGGSTFACKALSIKNTTIPNEVDMYTDEFLVVNALANGKCHFISTPFSVWRAHGTNYTVRKPIEKANRMISSATGIYLTIMKNPHLPLKFKSLYRLTYYSRLAHLKEEVGQKKWKDIFRLAKELFNNQHTFLFIKKFGVLKRLIPNPLISLLKNA